MIEQITAWRVWAVYASYDANAPNTEDLVFCVSEQLANQLVDHLNQDLERWGCLAFVSGCEYAKHFCVRQVCVEDPNKILMSWEEALGFLSEAEAGWAF